MAELTKSERDILLLLRNHRRPMKVSEMVEKSGMKLRTVYTALDRLKSKNLVEKTWEGYRIRRGKSAVFEMVYVSYGILCVLASVPLENPALTVFGSVSIVLGRLARRLENLLG